MVAKKTQQNGAWFFHDFPSFNIHKCQKIAPYRRQNYTMLYKNRKRKTILFLAKSRVGRYLKNQLTIIAMENIAIIDNIAINEIEKMTIFFKYN